VRDPRGWCLSSLNRNHKAEVGTAQGAVLWNLANSYAEAAWGRSSRYLRVR
jgi:hypothetical protein